MNDLRQLAGLAPINEDRVGSIHWEDEKFDADNPTVLIRGYGTLTLNTLQDNIARELADMSEQVLRGGLEVVANHKLLDEKSAFIYKVRAFLDVTEEMQNQHIKGKLTRHKKNSLFNRIKNSDQ